MRFMIMVKASKDSEAGVTPGEKLWPGKITLTVACVDAEAQRREENIHFFKV